MLWIGVVIGALAGAVVSLSRSDLDLARGQVQQAKATLAADSAAHVAIYALVNGSDAAIEPNGSVAAWRVPGAEVRVEISSEYGRLDLNRVTLESMSALLSEAGAVQDEAERLSAAIADYADADDSPMPFGAERRDYAAAGYPGPKNAPFEAEDELLGVLGMTGGLYRRVADAVTVHSGRSSPRSGQEHPLVHAALTEGPRTSPTPLPQAFSIELDRTPTLLRPGSAETTSDLVRIRAEAETEAGARAARVAVVSLRLRGGGPYSLLSWREETPILFPMRQRPADDFRADPARAGVNR